MPWHSRVFVERTRRFHQSRPVALLSPLALLSRPWPPELAVAAVECAGERRPQHELSLRQQPPLHTPSLPPAPPPPLRHHPHRERERGRESEGERARTDLYASEDAVRVESVLCAAAVHHGRARVVLVTCGMAVEVTEQLSFRLGSGEFRKLIGGKKQFNEACN